MDVRFRPIEPPRVFEAGDGTGVRLRDCARVELEPDEQVTFTTSDGGEYDVTRKSWGFYATPSTNRRLERYGLRAVIVRNRLDHVFVLLVERGHESDFEDYAASERLEVVTWLDRGLDTNLALG